MHSFTKIALSSLIIAGAGMPANAQSLKSFQYLTQLYFPESSKSSPNSSSCSSTDETFSFCASTSVDSPTKNPSSDDYSSPNSLTNNSSPSNYSSPNSPTSNSSSDDATSLEKAVYDQINKYRADRGLAPLSLNSRISEQARTHSKNMANGTAPFGHAGFEQRVQAIAEEIPEKAAAENVAYNQGYSDPASRAVQGWIRSDGHRKNIEGPFNLTGIGIAKNANDQYYFTQIFVNAP